MGVEGLGFGVQGAGVQAWEIGCGDGGLGDLGVASSRIRIVGGRRRAVGFGVEVYTRFGVGFCKVCSRQCGFRAP